MIEFVNEISRHRMCSAVTYDEYTTGTIQHFHSRSNIILRSNFLKVTQRIPVRFGKAG